MFFCDRCRVRKQWPESLAKSTGPCEICGKTRLCNDVPSSALPEPKKQS